MSGDILTDCTALYPKTQNLSGSLYVFWTRMFLQELTVPMIWTLYNYRSRNVSNRPLSCLFFGVTLSRKLNLSCSLVEQERKNLQNFGTRNREIPWEYKIGGRLSWYISRWGIFHFIFKQTLEHGINYRGLGFRISGKPRMLLCVYTHVLRWCL